MLQDNTYAVILAGGSGTRLWPLSRQLLPKQLLSMNGKESLYQQTIRRLLREMPPNRIITVTNEVFRHEVLSQARAVDPQLTEHILCEPAMRNTLPAIAWAVSYIARNTPDAIIGVFPSDHVITDSQAFDKAFNDSIRAASHGWIVTFGIQPDRPATGYGYIKQSDRCVYGSIYEADAFVEKPGLAKAKEYLEQRNYYWNAGMFVFSASTFLQELKLLQSEIYCLLHEMTDSLARDPDTELEPFYERFPSISIDYGLMEITRKAAVIPVEMGWNDLGSWNAFYQLAEKDDEDNVKQGEVVSIDSKNSLFLADHGVIGAIGLDNAVVIKTGDAVLVSRREDSENIKELVDRLKIVNEDIVSTPRTNRRPWGSYTVLEVGTMYKIKRLDVSPGEKLSLQKHEQRAEHWVVVAGTAHVINGEDEFDLQTNESTYIPAGTKHRLENRGTEPLQIIEVQTGAYLGEDDIIRLEDNYGRAFCRGPYTLA